jgi:tetratricopeptide (TPR) repeat protein
VFTSGVFVYFTEIEYPAYALEDFARANLPAEMDAILMPKRPFIMSLLTCVICCGIAATPGCTSKKPTPGKSDGTNTAANKGESGPANENGSGLTADQAREILSLHSRGVGHLENKEWVEAESILSQISQRLPGSVDAAKNLAAARVLSLLDKESPVSLSKDPKAFADMVQKATAAIAAYVKLAQSVDDKAIIDLLTGKLAVLDDSPTKPRMDEGLKHLREATSLAPERGEYWFALALALSGHRDYSDSPELIQTLQKTNEVAPENLAVLAQLLEKQAFGLNSKNDTTKQLASELPETMKKAIVLLEPLNASIKAHRKQDLTEILREALASPSPKPGVLMGAALRVRNLLVPELATQIDLRRIDRNLLEYLTIDLAATLASEGGCTGRPF